MNPNDSTSGDRRITLAAWFIIAIGVGLRLRGYLANHSLWLDELLIVRNLMERSLAELLGPLDHGQNVPIAWRLSIKLFSLIFGDSEYALRALPVAGGLLTGPLLWSVARRVIGARWALLVIGLWAISLPVINYAIQVKQYATDPLLALLVLRAALAWRDSPDLRRSILLCAAGIAAMLFSQPALFITGGAGLALILHNPSQPSHARPRLIGIGVVWLAIAAANYLLFIRLPDDRQWDWLYDYWSKGFMPLPPTSIHQALWLPQTLNHAMRDTLGLGLASSLAAIMLVIGMLHLYRTSRRDLALLGLPVALALLASAIHAYPFSERLILFLMPILLMLLVNGARCIAGLLIPRYPRAIWIIPAALLGHSLILAATWLPRGQTISMEHTRPIIAALAQSHQPGQAIVVPYWSTYAWWYYAPRFGLERDSAQWLERDDRDELGPLNDALARLDASGIWVVVTHYASRSQDTPEEYQLAGARFGRSTIFAQAPGAALIRIDRSAGPEAD